MLYFCIAIFQKKCSKDVQTEDDQEIKPRMDSYDRAVRELQFEARGKASIQFLV